MGDSIACYTQICWQGLRGGEDEGSGGQDAVEEAEQGGHQHVPVGVEQHICSCLGQQQSWPPNAVTCTGRWGDQGSSRRLESCSCRQCVEGEMRRALRIFKSR
jgi:hypothetical protein